MTTASDAWQALADWQPQKLTDLVAADPEANAMGKRLFLTYPVTAGFDAFMLNQPSLFVEELPPHLLEIDLDRDHLLGRAALVDHARFCALAERHEPQVVERPGDPILVADRAPQRPRAPGQVQRRAAPVSSRAPPGAA